MAHRRVDARLPAMGGSARVRTGFRPKDGKKLSFLLHGINKGTMMEIAEAVQSGLRTVGVEMRIQLLDADETSRSAAFQAVQQKVHDAAVWIPLYHEPLFLASGAAASR